MLEFVTFKDRFKEYNKKGLGLGIRPWQHSWQLASCGTMCKLLGVLVPFSVKERAHCEYLRQPEELCRPAPDSQQPLNNW